MARPNPPQDNTPLVVGGVALLGAGLWYWLSQPARAVVATRPPPLPAAQLATLQARLRDPLHARLYALEAAYYALALSARLPQGDPAAVDTDVAAIAAVDRALGEAAPGTTRNVAVLLDRVNRLAAQSAATGQLRPRALPYSLPQATIDAVNAAAQAVVPGFFQLQAWAS